MTEDPAYASQLSTAAPGGYDYDAFLSYSRADTAVAEGIQKGLHRIGRKLGRLHALRVFRDKTDLAASPSLWAKLTEALDKSRYLVVVLSPNSASSEWVNKEIDYWLAHRGRNNLVLVMADGTLLWDDTHGAFNPENSTAAPPALATPDALGTEPIYIDVSQDNPWDIQNPIFRDKLTDIAAPIHGKPKYELASEDLREQQRFRRFRRLAITALAVLTILSVVTAGTAFVQRREAIHQRSAAIQQRNEALAGRLVSDGEAILKKVRGGGDDRALQELVSAYRIAPTIAQGGLLAGLQATASTEKVIRSSDSVKTVAVTPDGNRIIFGTENDPVIHIADAQTGQSLKELKGHTKGVSSLALSSDGTRLVSGGYDKTVRVWDMTTGAPLGRPLNSSTFAGIVAISPDGTRVASASPLGDHIARVWDINTSPPVERTLVGHAKDVNSVAFSPDGQKIVTGGNDHTVFLWDAGTGERIGQPMYSELAIVYSVAFSPDGRRIISGHGSENSIRQWDPETGQLIGAPMVGHTNAVSTVTYSPDGKLIASGSWDKTVRLWSAESGKPLTEPMAGHENWVEQLVFSPDGHKIISGGLDATVRVWATNGGQLGRTATLGSFFESILSHDGQFFAGATSGNPPTVSVGDNVKERQVSLWSLGPEDMVTAMGFSPDHQRLAIGTMRKLGGQYVSAVQIFDVESGGKLIEIPGAHKNGINSVVFSPDGKRLATGGNEHPVKIWDAATGKQIGSDLIGAQSDVNMVAFSPDGRWLAAGSADRQLRVWDLETGKPIGDPMGPHKTGVTSVAVSPDGRLIASGDDGSVRIWDSRTHKLIGSPLTGHDDSVRALIFSPDGQLLVSGSADKSLRIWDVRSGQQIGSPLIQQFGADTVAFRLDGQRLVSASSGYLSIWPGPAQWPDLLCDKLTSNMSREQWKLWVSPDIDYIPACPGLPVPE